MGANISLYYSEKILFATKKIIIYYYYLRNIIKINCSSAKNNWQDTVIWYVDFDN